MEDSPQTYDQLVERFTGWAERQEQIRLVLVMGSRARTDHPADAWSDLDLVIFATEIEPFVADAGWIDAIGTPWLTFVEPTGDGRSLERRVLFEGGLDVDFAFFPVAMLQHMAQSGVPPDVADALRRGMRVLVDKDGLAGMLRAIASSPALVLEPPTEHEFLELINDFWYHAVWSAKHLRRGELWWAMGGGGGHVKALLLRLLGWHARAMRGPQVDTWMRGRFLEEWVDPRAREQLRYCFAHYEAEDIWRALLATMDLFRWVARETAAAHDYVYPAQGEERATELVAQLHAGRSGEPCIHDPR